MGGSPQFLGWGQKNCISNRFPSDPTVAAPETTLWEPLVWDSQGNPTSLTQWLVQGQADLSHSERHSTPGIDRGMCTSSSASQRHKEMLENMFARSFWETNSSFLWQSSWKQLYSSSELEARNCYSQFIAIRKKYSEDKAMAQSVTDGTSEKWSWSHWSDSLL